MNFPKIKTSRLILNQLENEDKNALFKIFSDEKVVKFYDIDVFESEQQSLELINFFNKRFAGKTGIRWAIRDKDTGELVGTCGFNSWNTNMKNATIGYELSSCYWGSGLASEALSAIIQFAFYNDTLFGQVYRIQGDTMLGNTASESVLRKLGFKQEGIRRSSGFWKGKFHDLKCFGLIKPEFEEV
ncbi:N-acetyltransferase [Pseudoalteromonas sp. J010]|uniref:GNAT family N-acetyltransferase n=1 Tax=Pseudoalteromonas sp. J010 TaxID=998465 RepID=UPI000F65568F|nr:GNAT family protein [Pseudoalteromonas sp. J010]RRS08490.1 N-acetyltransferase [Pseudoalteromonas sp. J010]